MNGVGENVTVTKHGNQTVTSNPNASGPFACMWLRARDVNLRVSVQRERSDRSGMNTGIGSG
jgi:hypothetical protein